ncbi:hypothetical protein [Vibrio syngnathi]|uniref:Uncharacterized protein n=1 Tax=Vibrio syngnathi TaxID=3034029 RepID=A0AA34TTT0_9VIBR|nr:hypothetical protein [Vibrio syngnathi]ARP40727.1 hypothetical protein K08M4_40660 [Vibrio syngnathi]
MTQLHLLAQYYFLETSFITLPSVKFLYKGEWLYRGPTSTRIISAELEKEFDDGKWKADVFLDTDIGRLVVEIMVTHATEPEKVEFYRERQLPSIEFDLSKLRSIELQDALFLLGSNKAPSKWLYSWCEEELIVEYERLTDQRRLKLQEAAKQDRNRILTKRCSNARTHAKKLLNKKKFTLPSITKTFRADYRGKHYEKIITLKPKSECLFHEVREVYACQDYLLFKGTIRERHLWIAYLLTDKPHPDVSSLDGSIVIRYPASNSRKQSEWEWLHHPSVDKAIKRGEEQFKTHCYFEYQRQTKTEYLLKELGDLLSEYIFSEEQYFRKHYHVWKVWLTKRGLFSSTVWKENPSIPALFKQDYFDSLPYWAFGGWHVYVCCLFAELVDGYKEGEYNSITALGRAFIKEVGVHQRYFPILN